MLCNIQEFMKEFIKEFIKEEVDEAESNVENVMVLTQRKITFYSWKFGNS